MGRGAKIFFIAFLISAMVFGLVSFSLLSALSKLSAAFADPDLLSEGAIKNDDSEISGESFNILIINVDYRPEKYSYDEAKVNSLFGNTSQKGSGERREISMLSAVLLRLDKEREEFTFTPIPASTYVNSGDKKESLSDIYTSLGPSALLQRVRMLTGLFIDEYAVVTPSAAEKITDILGGFEYNVISSVSAEGEESVASGNARLSGKQVRTLLLAEQKVQSLTREKISAALLREFFAALTEDGEATARTALGSILPLLQTTLDADAVDRNKGLISAYPSFGKKDIELCGSYKNEVFLIDNAETLDRFSNYRKYYS